MFLLRDSENDLLSHIIGARGSQDLRSPSPIMAPGPKKNWREGEKSATDFASSTRSAKFVFQAIVNFTIFTGIIFGVWSMFGWK